MFFSDLPLTLPAEATFCDGLDFAGSLKYSGCLILILFFASAKYSSLSTTKPSVTKSSCI